MNENEEQIVHRLLAEGMTRIAADVFLKTGVKDFAVRATLTMKDGYPVSLETCAGKTKPDKTPKQIVSELVKDSMAQAKKLGKAQ